MISSQLRMEQLACWRGDQWLIRDFSYTMQSGDLVQLVGANGSGKTSLLRMIAGLTVPDRGNVYWNQQSIFQQREAYAAQLLYIGHALGMKEMLTPTENLAFYQAVHASMLGTANSFTSNAMSIAAALAQMELTAVAKIPLQRLSAGQQRRVALARLYLSSARLWLLDEPFTAIDASGTAQLISLLHEHCQQGGMVLFTSHQPLSSNIAKTLMIDR